MTTKRDYAISLGLAKPTRGRMSREANAAIAKAEAEGMVFTDSRSTAPVKTDSSSGDSAAKPVKDSVRATGTFTGPTPSQLFDGGWYVVEGDKVTQLSGKEVCRTCNNSLDWHRCASPTFPAWNGTMIPVLRKVG